MSASSNQSEAAAGGKLMIASKGHLADF